MTSTHGGCLCGRTRYVHDPDGVLWRLHCHCESCRRATSSPLTTFFAVRDSAWRWLTRPPKAYASSPGVTRSFCPDCGSPLTYATDEHPDETHFHAMTLDDTAGLAPEGHDFWPERVAWLSVDDRLPKTGTGSG